MASYRAYFGGKVPGADDAFAGAEDVVPTCAEGESVGVTFAQTWEIIS